MMNLEQLATPRVLVETDILAQNIVDMAQLCRTHGKQLWPMVKTHKSSYIAKMQADSGAAGFLTGTVLEAEKLVEKGFGNIMLAYPPSGTENVKAVVNLASRARVVVTLDGVEAARELNRQLADHGQVLDYIIKIDCGLHRLGVLPEKAVELAQHLRCYPCLRLAGIGTHPGQAYASENADQLPDVAGEEAAALEKARDLLLGAGFKVALVATGSTPTAAYAVRNPAVTVFRPGNYVFNDNIQLSLGVAQERQCALTVLATVISCPQQDTFIINAGSKSLGLDKGAHGNSLIIGYGYVKGHPEAIVTSLSEEVGKIKCTGKTSLKVGDIMQIIPNHACSVANLTSELVGHTKGLVGEMIPVDMRR